jgi:hypothetical protein
LGHDIAKLAGKALSSIHAGDETLARARLVTGLSPSITVTSPLFENGATLPRQCTVDGVGVPPALRWTDPPRPAQSFVLLAEDPDAPKSKPFVHWLVYQISGDARSLDRASAQRAEQGENGSSGLGFTPAAPPPGHGLHHYHFQLFALDKGVALDPGASRADVLKAAAGHVIAFGDLVGTYERQ